MDILNGDGFYRHYIFYRLLPIDLHEFYHYYHFKVLNALSPFTIFTMYCCMKCVECITALILCIEYYTCFVRNDEIKMSNQSINNKIVADYWYINIQRVFNYNHSTYFTSP